MRSLKQAMDDLCKDKVISKDTVLPVNRSVSHSNIHIKDCILSLEDQGILCLTSDHDIVIENAQISLKGKTNANRRYGNLPEPSSNKYYGHKLHQIYIGKKGHRGDSCSGGNGGGGLRLACNKLMLKNSIINVSGSHCINGSAWWCGAGAGGSCLIMCNEFIMDDNSKILARNGVDTTNSGAGRIVIKIKQLLKSKQTSYLVCGYLRRNYDPMLTDELCNLCLLFFSPNDYTNYKISPKPIFVDDNWNVIDGIDTMNTWRKRYGRMISQSIVEIDMEYYGDRSHRHGRMLSMYSFEQMMYCPKFKLDSVSGYGKATVRVRLNAPELGGRVRVEVAKLISGIGAENIELSVDGERITWDDELLHENILYVQIQFCVVGYNTKIFDENQRLYKVKINAFDNSTLDAILLFRYHKQFKAEDFVNDLFLWMDKEKWFNEHKELIRLYFGKNEKRKGDNISYNIRIDGEKVCASHYYTNEAKNKNCIVELKLELQITGKNK